MATDTDHNDVAQKRGLKAVKKSVDSAIDAAKGLVFGAFLIMAGGVFWRKSPEDEPLYFCSYLKPLAICRDIRGLSASILFEMRNLDNNLVQFLLRIEDTQAGGGEYARIAFVQRGGIFGAGIRARQLFGDLTNSILRFGKNNLPRIVLADRTGWSHSGGKWSFVLPDTTIGPSSEKIILAQSLTGDVSGFEVSGNLEEWNRELGQLCIGNSRLILAVCSALAGLLLAILGRESGGFHLVGPSSGGKTTVLVLGQSVIGHPDGLRSFDATASATEGEAALSSDATLFRDELGAADAHILGGLLYKLSSGQGRGRADQRGEARTRKSWRALFLTSGEKDLETMLREIGKRPAAGQSLRLANIPSAPDGGFGIFDTLHGYPDGAALADHLKQAAGRHHGAPFRAFLEKLTTDLNTDHDGLRRRLTAIITAFVATVAPSGSDGQVIRVASRFGLLAAAGEYAAQSGILTWAEGEATWGIRECFDAWVQRRGGRGPLEVKTLLEVFEGWLLTNGEARFSPMDADYHDAKKKPVIVNRAGFRRECNTVTATGSSTEYFVFPAAFREAIGGHDPRWAAKVLHQHGLLAANDKGELCRQKKLPGVGNVRCYHVPARIEEESEFY